MTALITGASGGIGLELARIFAANRHEVVLEGHHSYLLLLKSAAKPTGPQDVV